MKQRKFEVGDNVICTNSHFTNLTSGHTYQVTEVIDNEYCETGEDDLIKINADNPEQTYQVVRFAPDRNKKIDNILNTL